MPNPQLTNCADGVWQLIATDQIFGYLFKMDNKPNKYLFTYRLTGQPAPTEATEGTPIFVTDEKKFVISGLGIDIYVMAVGGDGRVRYDWWW
jgi:hypothetical protein